MNTNQVRILLVEDNRHDSLILRRTLAKSTLNCQVTWVKRGEEALAHLENQTFDVALIDFKLPGLSGLETFHQMQAKGVTIPVIFVTGTGSEQLAVEALKEGAQDYLVKDSERAYLDLLPVVLRKALKQWEDQEARKRAEAELRQYAADLEAQNAELDAFAHTVAHDLKSPLAIMLSFAELLEDYMDELDKEAQAYLQYIIEYSAKMNGIIEALLLLAEVRKREVEIEWLDMEMIVTETKRRVHQLALTQQAQLILPKAWPAAYGYAPWIEEVWANYLSNAIKYGGEHPKIEVGATRLNGMVRFWVKDEGPGISPDDQARLFTPFTLLKNTKGHGLGLSIVQRIIQKCGGEVGVESQLGQGSTFWFTLPALAVKRE